MICCGINDTLYHHTTFTTMSRQWEELKETIRKNFKQQVSQRLVTSTTFKDFRFKTDEKISFAEKETSLRLKKATFCNRFLLQKIYYSSQSVYWTMYLKFQEVKLKKLKKKRELNLLKEKVLTLSQPKSWRKLPRG